MAVVVITGCSTGIGFAIAKTLAREGHRVYATMRSPEKSPDLLQLSDKEKLSLQVLIMDVNNGVSVQRAFDQVILREGQIDVLVNNAGIGIVGAVEDVSLDLHRSCMETNYFGTVRCIKAVLPLMRERQIGTIINISSVAGKFWSPFHGAYCATKAAVEALSESLAQEVLPFHIRVALVEPGVIETPIFLKGNEIPVDSHYPNIRRLNAFFAASLENHVQPDTVATVVRDIISGKADKFRHPSGPDAAPILKWRASVSDEEWVNDYPSDDETWIKNQEKYLHLNVRPFMQT